MAAATTSPASGSCSTRPMYFLARSSTDRPRLHRRLSPGSNARPGLESPCSRPRKARKRSASRCRPTARRAVRRRSRTAEPGRLSARRVFASCRHPFAEIAQYFPGAVMPGRAGDAAARVRTRAADVQTPKRRAVIGVSKHGPRRPQLIERQLAMEDVAAHQAKLALEVGGREGAVPDHAAPEAGRVRLDHVENALHRFAFPRAP